MDIGLIVGIVVVVIVILGIGGAGAWWFWVASRPKKITWRAKVWQLGEGVVPPVKDQAGNVVAKYRLSDLIPYSTDIVELINKKSGETRYWLNKLQKAVPAVTADCVENWGTEGKWVNILLEGDTCTLLKKGYERKLGNILFRPLPHDRISMIKTEVDERKARIEDTKDILSQITPWIVTGISMIALVIIFYFAVQGAIKIGELNVEAADRVNGAVNAQMDKLLLLNQCFLGEDVPVVQEEQPPEIPP